MYCRHLELTDFRNYQSAEIDFEPGTVLVSGLNAQGKSNLLESILALSTGRGRSSGPLSDLIRLDRGSRRPFARIRAEVVTSRGESRLELVFSTAGAEGGAGDSSAGRTSRRASADGRPTTLAGFIGRFRAVHFSPEDVDLLMGPPALRRRFLDISASQVEGAYLRNLMDYNRVISQRNALLRDVRARGATAGRSLEFWDEKLLNLAEPIVLSRRQFVSHLAEHAGEVFAELSNSDSALEFEYAVQRPDGLYDLELGQALDSLRDRELRAGQSLVGPHRDDLEIKLGGRPVGGFASRGQHRLIILSLKFAQLQWLTDSNDDRPVLLLDDIFSELDAHHRTAVAGRIPQNAQVLISTADRTGLPPCLMDSARSLRIEGGAAEWNDAEP